MTDKIYMDYAATTSVREEVLKAMQPYFTLDYANPSSLYEFASESRNAIEIAREEISNIINSKDRRYFLLVVVPNLIIWRLRV